MNTSNVSYLVSFILIALAGISLWACDPWELPNKKTKRECITPSGNLAVQIQQQKVDFSITNSTGTIDQISWDFGNGSSTTTTGMTVSYTYPVPGTYTVKVTLTNTCNQPITLIREVNVSNAVAPTVTLQSATDITTGTAKLQMAVTSTGNATITQYGICYSKTNPPTPGVDPTIPISGSLAINTSVPFSLSGLEANTVYYVLSFATNAATKTGTSNVQSFRTGTFPSVSITGNPTTGVSTATVNFVLNNPGNPAAVTYGVLYSSTSNPPTIDNSGPGVTVSNASAGGNTAVNLTNLLPNTTYYCRPYAKLASGEIVYGDTVSFKTQADPLAEGLVAYLPFTNGSLLDVSGNSNHANGAGGPGFTADRRGVLNSAVLFNGKSNYIYLSDNASLRPDVLSISLWVKPGIVEEKMQIYNKSNFADSRNEMYSSTMSPTTISGNKDPEMTISTDIKQNSNCQPVVGWQTFSTSIPMDLTWHHIVFTYAGRSARMYIDGALRYSTNELPASTIDQCPGGDLRFGAQLLNYPQYFNGAMDEIRIYRRSLSASEVQTLYNQ